MFFERQSVSCIDEPLRGQQASRWAASDASGADEFCDRGLTVLKIGAHACFR
jgi:hypothetical protein